MSPCYMLGLAFALGRRRAESRWAQVTVVSRVLSDPVGPGGAWQ